MEEPESRRALPLHTHGMYHKSFIKRSVCDFACVCVCVLVCLFACLLCICACVLHIALILFVHRTRLSARVICPYTLFKCLYVLWMYVWCILLYVKICVGWLMFASFQFCDYCQYVIEAVNMSHFWWIVHLSISFTMRCDAFPFFFFHRDVVLFAHCFNSGVEIFKPSQKWLYFFSHFDVSKYFYWFLLIFV